jgi:hypothetical protein
MSVLYEREKLLSAAHAIVMLTIYRNETETALRHIDFGVLSGK